MGDGSDRGDVPRWSADFLGLHDAAGFEDVEVLQNGREGHGEPGGEFGDGRGSAAQTLDQEHLGGIGERLEDAVERRPASKLVKHLAEY